MQAFFSSDGSFVVQFLVIFLVILVLLIGAVLLFRRLAGRGLSLSAGAGQRGRQPRLGIVDIYELDRQRQLILLRRDNVEHLLLVGGPNDVVIERHIQRGAGARYAAEGASRGETDAEATDAVGPSRAENFLDSPAPPTFTMPEVLPPKAAGPGQAVSERAPPLDPGLFEPDEPSNAEPPRPASAASRLMRRTPPPLVNPRPETASERTDRPVSDAAPPPREPLPEPPPVIASREPRAVDPAVLSDMARQLQVALKRPSSAVTPPPGPSPEIAAPAVPPPTPPAPAAKPAEAPPRPVPSPGAAFPARAEPPAAPPPPASKPAADAKAEPMPMAQAPKPTAQAPKPATTPPEPAAKPPEPAPPQPKAAPEVKTPTEAKAPSEAKAPEARPAPAPKPDGSTAPPAKPEPAKGEPTSAETSGQGQNPFSVEEIEAEFARLLGRPLDTKG